MAFPKRFVVHCPSIRGVRTDNIKENFDLLVAKNGNMGDVHKSLQKKANIDDEEMQNIRLYEAHGGKVYKELDNDFSVTSVNEFVILYAERIPDDERNACKDDRSIYAFHFDKEPNKTHGVPFKFIVKPVGDFMVISR